MNKNVKRNPMTNKHEKLIFSQSLIPHCVTLLSIKEDF